MLGKQQLLWAVAIIVGLGIVSYQTSHAEDQQAVAPAVTQWEYEVISQPANILTDKEANNLGEKGWELTAVAPTGTGSLFLYFKRPKSSL